MSDAEKFRAEVKENIERLKQDNDVQAMSRTWLREIARYKYA